MNSLFEKKKASIVVKSPIHIGSVEQKITPFEYIHVDQNVYRISDEKLSIFLRKKNLIDSFIGEFERDGHRFRMSDFFKNNKVTLKKEDLNYLSGGRKSKVLGNESQVPIFRPFIRDGFNNIYIPGTSIKGVIKTAILYNVLRKSQETNREKFKEIVLDRIFADIDSRVQKKKLFEWGIERWIEGFELNGVSRSPNTDWLRMLHVSDAYPRSNVETMLIPVNVLKKEESGWQLKTDKNGVKTTIWMECVLDDATFEFDILWDMNLLEKFKLKNEVIILPQNLNEIFKDINIWAKDIINFESGKDGYAKGHSLQSWYNTHSPNFRIGFGSGMSSTTIAMLLPVTLRKKVRNYAGYDRGDAIAPKSRRIWIKESQSIPMGWANLEVNNLD